MIRIERQKEQKYNFNDDDADEGEVGDSRDGGLGGGVMLVAVM